MAFMAAGPAAAQQDIVFAVSRKTVDSSKARAGDSTTREQAEIAYKVKVSSKSFRPLDAVTVKYNVFYEVTFPGSTNDGKIENGRGKHLIESITNTRPVEFETEPIKLSKTSLDGGYFYLTGAKGVARDKVLGLWFKAFDAEGKLLGEYVNPSTVAKKYDWKEPD